MDARTVTFITLVILAPIVLLFGYFGQFERGIAAWALCGSFGMIGYFERDRIIGVGRTKEQKSKRSLYVSILAVAFFVELAGLLVVVRPNHLGLAYALALLVAALNVFFLRYAANAIEGALSRRGRGV